MGSLLLAILVGLVVIGGLKRIAKVSERVIPVMVVVYLSLIHIYNSAELDNDDASGTKRGVMASNVATSLHASATSQESRPLIDCLLIVMGFGLCRAWIVSCLSASVASYSLRTDWVYLLAGAGAAALAAFAMTRYAGSLARMLSLIHI